MPKQFLFLTFLFALILGSCVQVDRPEPVQVVAPDQSECHFSAEFGDMNNDSTAVIQVVSNRSWFAVLNDLDNPIDPSDSTASVTWGTLDVNGHSNLQHITDTVSIHVTVHRNKTQVPVNGAIDFYSEGAKMTSVRIGQSPAVYHLDAIADRQEIACKMDSVRIAVNCNTTWTARILESSAEVSLSDTLGFDPGEVYVKFGENLDVSATKTATVVLSAKDCPDKIIEFSQSKAEPYMEWDESMNGKLNAWESTGTLVFRTNCAWTIEASDGTLTNIEFDKTSGPSGIMGNQEVSFSFVNTLKDPMTAATATVTLKTDYTKPIDLVVTQRPQLTINLAANNFTPEIPEASSAVETTHSFTFSGEQYSMSIFLMRFIKNKLYFVSGNDSGSGYIKFPVIPDATLRGIEIFIKGQSTYYKITAAVFDEDGNQMSDQYSFSTTAVSTTHLFILGENGSVPVENTQYKLMGLAKQTCCINKIVLSYVCSN